MRLLLRACAYQREQAGANELYAIYHLQHDDGVLCRGHGRLHDEDEQEHGILRD